MPKFISLLVILFSIHASANITLEDVVQEFFESKNMRVTNIVVNEAENPISKVIDPDGDGGRDHAEVFFKYRGNDNNCNLYTTRTRLQDGRIRYSVRIDDCGSIFLNQDRTREWRGDVYFEN